MEGVTVFDLTEGFAVEGLIYCTYRSSAWISIPLTTVPDARETARHTRPYILLEWAIQGTTRTIR